MEEILQDDKPQLDPTIEETLRGIIKKEPRELTDFDKGFLRARKSMLGKNARAKFADILNEKVEEKKDKPDPKKDDTKTQPHPGTQDDSNKTTTIDSEDDIDTTDDEDDGEIEE